MLLMARRKYSRLQDYLEPGWIRESEGFMYSTHVQSHKFHVLLCSDSYCSIFMVIIGQGLENLRPTPGKDKFSLQPRSGRLWGPHNLPANPCGIYGYIVAFSKQFGFPLPIMNPPIYHSHLSLCTGRIGHFSAALPTDLVPSHSPEVK
jgi:hypothetical protein